MRSGFLAASAWSSNPEFDDFLSASVGEELNGRLSVISMFGRLNIDPRKKAIQLASLPRAAAAQQLASLIESLPDRIASAADAKMIAAHLVLRLPAMATSLGAPRVLAEAAGKPLKVSLWVLLLIAGLAIWFGVELMSEKQTPPASGAATTEKDRP